jgi:hypothetical protein
MCRKQRTSPQFTVCTSVQMPRKYASFVFFFFKIAKTRAGPFEKSKVGREQKIRAPRPLLT